MKNQASTNNVKFLNVPKQGYKVRNSNDYGYAHNLKYMYRNLSQHANMSRHAYPRNYNTHIRNSNSNYHANNRSRDLIITIFPRSDNNHAFRGDSKYMRRRNPYHISNRNQASRNDIIYVNNYPMPRFFYENSRLPYDVLTLGPSRKKGTNRFN